MPWTVRMRYESGRAEYPEKLPKKLRSRVVHAVKEGKSVCLLSIDKGKDANIPGARWRNVFDSVVEEEKEEIVPEISTEDNKNISEPLKAVSDILNNKDLWDKVVKNYKKLKPEQRENILLFRLLDELKSKVISLNGL